jgi:hypothetical protein
MTIPGNGIRLAGRLWEPGPATPTIPGPAGNHQHLHPMNLIPALLF